MRVTVAGARSYIFETRLQGKTIRITIGDTRTWTVAKAQAEATSHKAQTDQGIDPRQVRAEKHAAQEAAKVETAAAALRESVTLGAVWPIYVEDRMRIGASTKYQPIEKSFKPAGKGASAARSRPSTGRFPFWLPNALST